MLLLSLMKPLSKAPQPLKYGLLRTAPSLIILHEPSAFFLEARSDASLLSHYLQLVTTAFATASFLSTCAPEGTNIPVVLFDYRLSQLKLPIIRRIDSPRRRRRSSGELVEEGVRNDRVSTFVEKYFHWVGTVSGEEEIPGEHPQVHFQVTGSDIYIYFTAPSSAPPPSTFDESGSGRATGAYKLLLQNRRQPSEGPITWEWSEKRQPKKTPIGRTETRLVWNS